MNGVVFQTSAMMIAHRAAHSSLVQRMLRAEERVDDAVGGEDEEPQLRGDGGGDRPRHQHRRAEQAAAAEGAVHDEGHPEPEHGLERDGDDREEERVADRGPELAPRVPGGQGTVPLPSWHCCSSQWM